MLKVSENNNRVEDESVKNKQPDEDDTNNIPADSNNFFITQK